MSTTRGAALILVCVSALARAASAPQSTTAADWERAFLAFQEDRSKTGNTDGMSEKALRVIVRWPGSARRAAEALMERYGGPDSIGERVLVWNANGPWKRTVVHRDDAGPYPRRPGSVQQTIDYDVPREKADALPVLAAGVAVAAGGRELSATNESEELNFLAMNLADAVLTGKLTPQQARAGYAKTLMLADSGKSSPLTTGLRFVPRGRHP